MSKRRERKHEHIDVTGTVPLEDRPARWEIELILAALARLAAATEPTAQEVPRAQAS